MDLLGDDTGEQEQFHQCPIAELSIGTDGNLLDNKGRTLVLRGVNFAGDSKNPKGVPSWLPADQSFWDGQISFVNVPIPLDEADQHFERIKKAGFNVVRFIYTWEALEHKGPGIYDEEYIDYVIALLRKLGSHGLYAFMDPHQDVWSRYCGGSGAPLWTLHAAGLAPQRFKDTQAALLENSTAKKDYLKMIWATNYERLACLTMFTLFYAGSDFAPKCTINGQNIQEYLQSRFFGAVEHFASRIHKAGLSNNVVLGWESINEPSGGLIGHHDITARPRDLNVRLGTAPTALQAMALGSGHAVTVDTFEFTGMGPKKTGQVTVDPRNTSAWLSATERDAIDLKHGWNRSESWQARCIWAQHGVWNDETGRVSNPNYFAYDPSGRPFKDPTSAFVDNYFITHWHTFVSKIRAIYQPWFVFLQPPVNVRPPKGNKAQRVIYTPHYYDGLTLVLKRWSRLYNVDALGVLREKYPFAALALRIGEPSIRSCLGSQLSTLKSEAKASLGDSVGFLISEIGIPYDMDGKAAFESGNYESQLRAMDAIHNALEASTSSHALWVYTVDNNHEHGDNWNQEDLSIHFQGDIRTPEAVIRPFPVTVSGIPASYSFDIKNATFTLKIKNASDNLESGPPTTVFLPPSYFPEKSTAVSTSSGHWSIESGEFRWWHGSGTQKVEIQGVTQTKLGPCVIM